MKETLRFANERKALLTLLRTIAPATGFLTRCTMVLAHCSVTAIWVQTSLDVIDTGRYVLMSRILRYSDIVGGNEERQKL